MIRKTSPSGIALITRFEGLRNSAYLCPAGVPTIGYGHTLDVHLGQVINRDQALALLADDLSTFEAAVNHAVGVPLSQNQFDALVSLAFNIGAGAFGKSSLVRALNAGRTNEAADWFRAWNKGGGRILPGLTARRDAERALFLQADAPKASRPAPSVAPAPSSIPAPSAPPISPAPVKSSGWLDALKGLFRR